MWEIPDELGMMSTWDLHDYITNKAEAQRIYNETGVWDKELAKANQALRDKYGIKEDNFTYNDLGKIRANIIFGQFLKYGLESDNKDFQRIAE